MGRTSLAALAAALMLVAGCGGPRLTWDHQSADIKSFFGYAATDHEVTAAVLGSPFAGREKRTEEVILEQMSEGLKGVPQSDFVAWDGESAFKEPYFVVALEAAPVQQAWRLCRLERADGESGQDGGDLRLMMVFCASGRLLSRVEALMPRPDGPDSPHFRDTIREAMGYLVPIQETEGPESDSDALP